MTVTNSQIAAEIERYAPLTLQEQWDNSGWQMGHPDAVCSGVLICVDASEAVVDEAVSLGANLIVAHYSLNIFSEIQFYKLSLYISYLQMFSFGLNTHEISRF